MTLPRPWPFKSADPRCTPEPTPQPVQDAPLCECDMEHLTPEAVAANLCTNCGLKVVA